MTKIDLAIDLLQKILDQLMCFSPSEGEILDSNDVKKLFKIGNTKFYQLKKKGILKSYNLDGKDIYLKEEVMKTLTSRPKSRT